MNPTELQLKLEEIQRDEADIIARQNAATTDKQRFEYERMRRIMQTLAYSLIDNATREQSRGHTGRIGSGTSAGQVPTQPA